MKINSLLAGTLALVLIAGTVSPVFAQVVTANDLGPLNPDEISNIQTSHNIVFDNGGAPDGNQGLAFDLHQIVAEDFIIDSDTLVTDFHFVSIGVPVAMEYRIYANDGVFPGAVLASGFPQDLGSSEIGISGNYEIWFDLEEPFLAEAGEKYWFGMTSTLGFDGAWLQSESGGFGAFTVFKDERQPLPWLSSLNDAHSWFLLSGHSPNVVGGNFLPIDSTALILAGAQTNALWMLSALAVIGSVAFGALYITSKKN